MRVNVTGTFLLCRARLPAMVGRRSGSAIVIGSTTGKRPLYGRTPYAASKRPSSGWSGPSPSSWDRSACASTSSRGAVARPFIESVIREQVRAAGISYEAAHAETTRRWAGQRLCGTGARGAAVPDR